MVQIIAIKVGVNDAKRKTKALKLAAAAPGVESVELLNGEDGVIVTGDEVDAVCLTNSMRKKFGYAKLLSLQHVSPNKGGGGSDGGGDGGGDEEEETSPCCPCKCYPCNCNNYYPFQPPPSCYITCVYDADPICSIM